jgi:sugar (pentulose or hexulose) kinase
MYLLGVDIGTSGVKALLIDESGAVVASASESYPLYTPRPLWAEQNPTTGGREPARRYGACWRNRALRQTQCVASA